MRIIGYVYLRRDKAMPCFYNACRAEPDWEPAAQLLARIQQENKR